MRAKRVVVRGNQSADEILRIALDYMCLELESDLASFHFRHVLNKYVFNLNKMLNEWGRRRTAVCVCVRGWREAQMLLKEKMLRRTLGISK